MNKISKKPKQKSFNKSKSKVKEKSMKTKEKTQKINKNIEELDEISDKNLKQELNQIIKDFNKTNQNSKKSSKLKRNDNNKTFKDNSNQTFKGVNKSTSNQSVSSLNNSYETPGKRRKLLVKTQTKWYEMRIFDDSMDLVSEKPKYNPQRVQELRREAEELFRIDIEVYQTLQEKNVGKQEDFQWIRTVLKSGTLGDKLSAHTVLIQDSAVHNLRSLESMLGMVTTKGKRECIMALDNLRDLLIGDLLIPNKKLKPFSDLLHFFDDKNKDKKSRNRQLIVCLFEEKLKLLYRQFLERLATVGHDSVDSTKNKSLVTFFDLLVNNGEQEQYLLENLVNKLGDPLAKLAAQATHLLNQLINQYHPFMKKVVVEEVERLLYRPNIGQRAQYYGLCFLSEVIFTATDKPLANKLIQLYFGFFKACIKKGDINNKMMSVLLTGVSRAFPYSKLETSLLEDNLQTFYKLIHFVNQNTSIQALLLIFNIIDVNQSGLLTDRFYTVLYRHLLDIQLDSCSRKAMFLNLVFRAMKRDPILKRVKAFIKRLLQISLTQSSSLTTSILILISEVIKSKPGLLLTKEVIGEEVAVEEAEDEDDEHYEDVPLSDDEVNGVTVEDSVESKPKTFSWVHNKNIDTNRTKTRHYDPNARNPLFAGAELIDLWELAIIKTHFHPSTSLFAQKILDNQSIDYSGDPINDFSLKHFLDKFVFRNPKKFDKNSANSTSSRVFGRLPNPNDGQVSDSVTVNSNEYINQPQNRIPIDERFIHQYLKQRLTQKTDGYDSDLESVTSVEFESLLDQLEPMSKKDFAKDVYKESKDKKSNKNSKKSEDSDEEESDTEFDQNMDEDPDEGDSDVEFDEGDPDFADAFGDVDSELEDALQDNGSSIRPNKRKKGFTPMTTDLFASADEFAQLLEANESDSGLSEAAEDETKIDRKSEFRKRRKLGRNKKRVNKRDLDL